MPVLKTQLNKRIELVSHVVAERRSLILQLTFDEFHRFLERRSSGKAFSIAAPHDVFKDLKFPTICYVFDASHQSRLLGPAPVSAFVGIAMGKSTVTTLETRVSSSKFVDISPHSPKEIGRNIEEPRMRAALKARVGSAARFVSLPPALSRSFVTSLASDPKAASAITRLLPLLGSKARESRAARTQIDAIESALQIFGLSVNAEPRKLALNRSRKTGLSKFWLNEDAVIEHDARAFPQFRLAKSYQTGLAEFRKGSERLQIITANRRPLERVLGVDLIYINLTHGNAVLVQYKMLTPASARSGQQDWVYRPASDRNFAEEMRRMQAFRKIMGKGRGTYRLNPEPFYLKFVKRDQIGEAAAITIPLEHFERLVGETKLNGARGGLRVSYGALEGLYLRDHGFFDLIRSGYIGSHSTTTTGLSTIVRSVVDGDRALVAAIQAQIVQRS